MNKVSKRLMLSVANTLQQADGPMRTSDIAAIVGKSHTSVNSALAAIGAHRVPDMYPAEWVIGEEGLAPVTAITSATPRVGETRGQDYLVSAPEMEPSAFISNWNKNRKAFGKRMSELEINETVDPKELVSQLATFAGAVAGLAATIDAVKDRPDWFEVLS